MIAIRIQKCVVQRLCFMIFAFIFMPSYAQKASSTDLSIAPKYANFSADELLNEAIRLRSDDTETATLLAKEALQISNNTNNPRASGEAYLQLGKLAKISKKYAQAKQYFWQSADTYKRIGNRREYILSSAEYIKLVYREKHYKDGINKIDELLSLAEELDDDMLIVKLIYIKGEGKFKQKKYDDAIFEYKKSIQYLQSNNKTSKKRLSSTYHFIAQCYKKLKSTDNAINFYKKALDLYKTLGDKKAQARELKNIGKSENSRGNYLIALDYYIRSLDILRTLNSPSSLAEVLTWTGVVYRNLGRYEKSLENIHEAHLIYRRLNNISKIAETSSQIGLLYTRLKQFDQARSFYQLTIDLPQDKIEPKAMAAALREIAVIDYQAGSYDSALLMANKSYNIYEKIGDISRTSLVLRQIGEMHLAQGNKEQAIIDLRKSLSLARKSKNKNRQVKSLFELGSTLIDTDNLEAIKLLEESLNLAIQKNMKKSELSCYIALKKAEKKQGNINRAFNFAEKQIALSKIISDEESKNEFIKAKAKLDSHKKELEIISLQEKVKIDSLALENKNSELEIVRQANQISELELTKNRYATVALIALLVICVFVIIYIYRIFIASRTRNKELDYLAARDPLTNCYNRRTLFDLINRDFSELEELKEYCVIMADIDHFKKINDTHGHGVGDTVIRGVAGIMLGSVRQSDIVARYGGEEFCIILPGAHEEKASLIADTMRKKILTSQFSDISVTCSFGVSTIKFGAKSPTELIDQADLALYKSKTLGRNQVSLWDQSIKANP